MNWKVSKTRENNSEQYTLPVAVIRSWPHCKDHVVEVPLEALHDQLMSPTDHIHIVGLVELLDHVHSKQVAGTTWRETPTLYICVVGSFVLYIDLLYFVYYLVVYSIATTNLS